MKAYITKSPTLIDTDSSSTICCGPCIFLLSENKKLVIHAMALNDDKSFRFLAAKL